MRPRRFVTAGALTFTSHMEILIKNMVCRHCVNAVEGAFVQLGLHPESIVLGKAVLAEDSLDGEMMHKLRRKLAELGFDLITDPEDALVEKTKLAILHHLRSEEDCRLTLSACIAEHLPMSYDAISRIFSAKEGRTIEKYFIAQKIERVKELMDYRLTLSEIADKVGYSSVAHLSRQFKELTGMTPTQYLKTAGSRKPLPDV